MEKELKREQGTGEIESEALEREQGGQRERERASGLQRKRDGTEEREREVMKGTRTIRELIINEPPINWGRIKEERERLLDCH